MLEALRGIAPVTAVRGNNDRAAWARDIPETTVLEEGGARIFVPPFDEPPAPVTGAPDALVMQRSGHKSVAVYQRYVRQAKAFAFDPLAKAL